MNPTGDPQAIPSGYMRIGELAKKAEVTVRTLQYYDKEGLLAPSAESEGGYRLYTDKDMVKLVQILMMKELGFPLREIKRRLTSLDTPQDVVTMLAEHTNQMRMKIEAMTESLNTIDALQAEIAQMETVDFQKYAHILVNLQIKNKNYWMVKHFDNDVLLRLGEGMDVESATKILETNNRLLKKAEKLQKQGELPDSAKSQRLAKEFWEMMLQITGGDFELMEKMNDNAQRFFSMDESHIEGYVNATQLLRDALAVYLRKIGYEHEIFDHAFVEKKQSTCSENAANGAVGGHND